jgi:peptide-methionine (S)-S-oxide reductase
MLSPVYCVLLMTLLLIPATVVCSSGRADTPGAAIPEPAVDESPASSPGEQSIVLAGGCFWGVQVVFQHVKGVKQAISGYAGGQKANARYELVSTGTTGHAESVKVTYDPSQITLGKLLRIFFSVAHDPTQLNRQGPDEGSQYRSAIFYSSPEQKKIAESYVAQLNQTGLFPRPIATQVVPLDGFYAAEAYHQDYATLHPDQPYIAYNDLPKVTHLREQFPELYVAK